MLLLHAQGVTHSPLGSQLRFAAMEHSRGTRPEARGSGGPRAPLPRRGLLLGEERSREGLSRGSFVPGAAPSPGTAFSIFPLWLWLLVGADSSWRAPGETQEEKSELKRP